MLLDLRTYNQEFIINRRYFGMHIIVRARINSLCLCYKQTCRIRNDESSEAEDRVS